MDEVLSRQEIQKELEQLRHNCKLITNACNNYLDQFLGVCVANDFLRDEIMQLEKERDKLEKELSEARKDLEAQQRISFNSNRSYDF